ncbi:hypothetical protein QBC47DRAFT_375666 [Echria macrotheca]|uniref:Uncharacterized protein n=1 Tax=Echria macrotheca TaxID=438768 RepID=A0AAJ0BG15_9PEZI|nr:hypothetical protein QBC47DRAFT_375666 [Echria macrotheca]
MPANKYPGWNLDLRWLDQIDDESRELYPTGIHYNCYGADSAMLLVREVAMMLVMDRLTDKPDWHVKVFDQDIVAKWREEALAWPDEDLWERINNLDTGRFHFAREEDREAMLGRGPKMSRNILDGSSVDYCILELRQKAEHFNKTGIVPTLDATFSIAKSDGLVSSELHAALQDAFARLKADQASNPDWHPNTDETVQDLVHPSMYPLVYGRSRFFEDEVVGVEDAIDNWAGKGDVIPRQKAWEVEPVERSVRYQRTAFDYSLSIGGSGIHKSYWSTTYQWLPSNVAFTPEGGVRITSYINNLHPNNYGDIYKTVEKLIETALPMWDQCLVQYNYSLDGPGRHEPRMIPGAPDDDNPEHWVPPSVEEMLAQEAATKAGEDMPEENMNEREKRDKDWKDHDRWSEMRQPLQEPAPDFEETKVKSYKVRRSKTLRERFKDTGLQIIVKMAPIELTPEKPEFAPGGWHVEGQMNEHIVATALYYIDSENITDSQLYFRTITSHYQDDFDVGQGNYQWMQSVYGVKLGGSGSPCLQNYGSVMTPQGRLLAFPNVFHHRVSGFELKDKTKPGHRRFIALWLVDPLTRIISTANVPPQQAEWWDDRVFRAKEGKGVDVSGFPPEMAHLLLDKGFGEGHLDEALAQGKLGGGKLPPEIMNMVRSEFGDDFLMTREEAEEHRSKLMATRSAFQGEAIENWRTVEYSFCEH